MSKKYYWLKLKDDFFRSKEVKKLRKISGGDTFTIIYLKMQLLSIKKSGVIEYEGTEEDLAEQLALELDENIEDIKVTLLFMESNKLIEMIEEDSYLLNRVPALIGSETDAAERMRKMRSNRNNVTPQLQDVTQRKEIETDKDIELEKKIKKPTQKQVFSDIIFSYTDSPTLIETIENFVDMRKSIKAKMTEHALKLMLTKLSGMSNSESEKIEILNQSIMNSWKGIFPLKNSVQTNNNTNTSALEAFMNMEG